MRSKIAQKILDETPEHVRQAVREYGDRVVAEHKTKKRTKKIIISYVAGWYVKELGGGTLDQFPAILTYKTIREFTDDIRGSVDLFFNMAKENCVIVSSMTLLVNINNKHYFCIRLKNVREYKKLVDDYKANT